MIVRGLLGFFICGGLYASTCSECASLEVKVSGIRNDKGLVRILLTRDEKNFNEEEAEKLEIAKVYFREAKADPKGINFRFRELPSGSYAYKVFHDENENKRLDQSLLGRPLEGVSVSNYKEFLGNSPEFAKAKFELKSRQKARHSIEIQYLSSSQETKK